jgi:hypothetical protein
MLRGDGTNENRGRFEACPCFQRIQISRSLSGSHDNIRGWQPPPASINPMKKCISSFAIGWNDTAKHSINKNRSTRKAGAPAVGITIAAMLPPQQIYARSRSWQTSLPQNNFHRFPSCLLPLVPGYRLGIYQLKERTDAHFVTDEAH